MQSIIRAPENLAEQVFDKFTKFRSLMIQFYDSGYFLFVFLALLSIVIYYTLRYLIGLRLGSQLYTNVDEEQN
jgi:hypothetical protein